MTSRTSTPHDWVYPVLAGALGLLMAVLARPEDGSPAARFLIGVLTGISAGAVLVGVLVYFRDHPLHR